MAKAAGASFKVLRALRGLKPIITWVPEIEKGTVEIRFNPDDLKAKGFKLSELTQDSVIEELAKVSNMVSSAETAAKTAAIAHSLLTVGPKRTVERLAKPASLKGDGVAQHLLPVILDHLVNIRNELLISGGKPPVTSSGVVVAKGGEGVDAGGEGVDVGDVLGDDEGKLSRNLSDWEP